MVITRKTELHNVSIEDFARSFGTTVDDFSGKCREMILENDFRYRIVQGKDRDQVILEILKKIDNDRQVIGAPERKAVWENGWRENLVSFIESKYDLNALVPKFIRPDKIIRYRQEYIVPVNSNFELAYFSVFRHWLFQKYMKNYDSIYEFGCGTGFNLVELIKMYPTKNFYGMDFVSASVNLVNSIGGAYSWPIKGYLFDMKKPDRSMKLDKNSAIFTIGAVEQLAGEFKAFLEYLLEVSPGLCVHVEPTIELYDEDILVDFLAMKFHQKRGYTENFLPSLREMESQGLVDILKVQRLFFGSQFMEGYTYLIWKPGHATS